jgi:hypothetical protein
VIEAPGNSIGTAMPGVVSLRLSIVRPLFAVDALAQILMAF